MQPALRTYLTKLREQSYVDIQPGFVDSGASAKESKPVFTAYAPPPVKKKKVKTTVRFDRSGRAVLVPVKDAVIVQGPDTTGGRTLTGAEAETNTDPSTGLAKVSAPAVQKTGAAGKNGKVAKIKREKIRYGQAPRNALPGGDDEVAVGNGSSTPATLQSNQTQATNAAANGTLGGVSTDAPAETANLSDNPLTPVAPPRAKTRFASKSAEVKVDKAKAVSAKKQEKAAATPMAATTEEKTAAQTQAAPLGLNGDTSKKPAKPKKEKGAPKERLEDKKKVEPAAPAVIAPTANPALAPTDSTPPSTRPTPAPATPPSI